MCQLMFVFSWTHMANIFVYLGHTVHDNTTMRDAKRMMDLMWAVSQSLLSVECVESAKPVLRLKVGPMNL